MSRRCDILGTGSMVGHSVSHANNKTKRRFNVNLQNISFYSDILGRLVQLRVANKTRRTIEKNGGLDTFLLTAADKKLTETAIALRKILQSRQKI